MPKQTISVQIDKKSLELNFNNIYGISDHTCIDDGLIHFVITDPNFNNCSMGID